MVFPDDVRHALRRRYETNHRQWADGKGQWPLTIPLGIPTQREAAVATSSVRAWIEAWSSVQGLPGEVLWEERRWRSLGAQRLPARLLLASPEEAAGWIGEGERWSRVMLRRAVLVAQWPPLAAPGVLASHFGSLADYSDLDFERLLRLIGWLARHPKSGLYPRELPIEGVDTKWLEGRPSLVTELLRSVLGIQDLSQEFHAVCGLRRVPTRIRLRIVCPELAQVVGGLRDLEVPVEEAAQMPLKPQTVLIVENLETGLAVPEIAGAIVVLKLGNAVTLLGNMPWIHSARSRYWGDIDTHGFAILHRARQCLPHLQSLLMDESTLLAHRALWTEERTQCNAEELDFLETHERAVFLGLRAQKWGTHIRLEQERIPWEYAKLAIERTVLSPPSHA